MANAEFTQLVKKRSTIKSKLTLFEKYIANIESAISTLDRAKIIELDQRIDSSEGLLNGFDDIQGEIECRAEDPDKQLDEREQFENKFYSVLAKAKSLSEIVKNIENNDVASELSERSAVSHSNQLEGVKLPEIKLPKFDGSYETWLEFRDIFESLIHHNTQIKNIQKFHYLRASLVGSAPQVIQSLEFSANNYAISWNTLCERFDNKRLLIHNHIKAIFGLEPIKSSTAEKIRHLNDNLLKHLSSLKQLGEPTESWDTLIIYIVSNKLDVNTAREWEREKAKHDVFTLGMFKSFLKSRADLLETMEINFENSDDNKQKRRGYTTNTRSFVSNNGDYNESNVSNFSCFLCKKGHSLFYCPDFLKLSIKDRISKVNQLQLCRNCLRRNHQSKDCTWSSCKMCNGKHNTVLHENREKTQQTTSAHAIKREEVNNDRHSQYNTTNETVRCTLATAQYTILSTAKVHVYNSENEITAARALLDCGSQSSFITSDLCERLQIPTEKSNLTVSGINDKTTFVTKKCDIKIQSIHSSYSFDLSCFVIEKITNSLPETLIERSSFNIPLNIQLADPNFHIPKTIDILIGADAFWQLLSVGRITAGPQNPILQKTRLGWIVAGPLDAQTNSQNGIKQTAVSNFCKIEIQEQLAKFWEVEEVSSKKPILSFEEQSCEQHFSDHLTISSEGRYVVSILFKDSINKLGESRETAIKRFLNLERKLIANDTLRHLYIDFLNEYERLGHMTEIPDESDEPEYLMPHHGVLREASSTTKLCVVFNASSPTSTGVSLNELQMTGPAIQQDLLSIVLRFRMYSIVLSSDIKMMYRQILINPNQRNLQKIVWRSDPDNPIKTYQLNTVTYGTTAASFLAVRCLYELANECQERHPKIADIIRNDMYVDDLLTGANSFEEATLICQKISAIFLNRGFELRKWKSNDTEVINGLHSETSNAVDFSHSKDYESKTLGLSWACDRDVLTYKILPNKELCRTKCTKRSILSRIATIFDPLGLISPCVIIAKVLLQRLWAEKLTWDQTLPNNILKSWLEFTAELDALNSINIPRRVTCASPTLIELHGFSDASEASYGACIYVVSKNAKNERVSSLFCAKSKVAPLKSLTMPRLELCAALILSQLIDKVLESVPYKFDHIHCWSDSTIVLGWLRTSPNLLKPFVDHRVAEIQKLSSGFEWRHVPTQENPADLVSRGVRPLALLENDMWWHGPQWLLKDSNYWPNVSVTTGDLPERRRVALISNFPTASFPFKDYSNLNKLKRYFAYVLRFIKNCQVSPEHRCLSHLNVDEMNCSIEALIRMAQRESFNHDYFALKKGKDLPSNSNILSLRPFIDKHDILRVGGRLSNSNYPYAKKHPILLSPNHHLTKLIFEYEHKQSLHAGPQLLLARVREQFWPISGRSLARKIVQNCMRCSRFNSRSVQPIMADLPAARVQPALPFSKVGVDYAGPFLLKDRRGRGYKIIKCWIALFICFVTRAIHLEVVMTLSSDDFLQAFSRFISRRGKPSDVYSDNGTNFVRANKEINLMEKFLQENESVIAESSANLGIRWHFIPVNSPHFGGIWEAGVKSCKYHLKRVMGNHTLYFQDFQTLIIRIEAVLNSRPLFPISSNPDDLCALSPSHFLIGRQHLTLPEPSVTHLAENRLSNYQLLQQLYQHFWNRWSTEYLSELQQRNSSKRTKGTLQIGQLILIKENNVPPMKWKMGRVLDLVPGRDGVNRVAIIKTSDGVVSRAVVRLCPLPSLKDASSKAGGMFSPSSTPLPTLTRSNPRRQDRERADRKEPAHEKEASLERQLFCYKL